MVQRRIHSNTVGTIGSTVVVPTTVMAQNSAINKGKTQDKLFVDSSILYKLNTAQIGFQKYFSEIKVDFQLLGCVIKTYRK